MEIITCKDITKKFGNYTALNSVSLSIPKGEIFGLLGPNGAGKTTSFYMMTGLVVPNGGKIFLDDEDITKLPMYKRSQLGIGYLAQEASVFRKMTVEDNIRSVLEMTNYTKEYQRHRLEELIEEFRSIGLGGLYLSGLSSSLVVSMGTGTALVHADKKKGMKYGV